MVEFCLFTEPQQGATDDELLTLARVGEEAGFDGFFRSDHYLSMGDVDGLPGPTDAWVSLAALARGTSRVRLGTLVSPATFRPPGVLAIQAAQVDRISGGRVEVGLGAGWYEAEHTAYGIPFPSTGERFDRLTEQLEIVTGLWATRQGERYRFEGKHYRLIDSPALPKPVQSPVPLIIGGAGPSRTPALAARFATEFNAGFCDVAETAVRFDRVRRACAAIGRPETDLRLSWVGPTLVGRDDAEVSRRAAAIAADPVSTAPIGLVGTPEQVAQRLRGLVEIGVRRFYLQLMDLRDLAHAELIASEVLPRLA